MILIAAVVVLGGCQQPTGPAHVTPDSSPSSAAAPNPTRNRASGTQPPPLSGCTAPGPKTGGFLPLFNGAEETTNITRVAKDFCISLLGIVGQVTPFVAEAEKLDKKVKLKSFVGRLDKAVGTLGQVADVAECAYQTDRLAIGIYRHDKHLWSLAVVAVVRGGVEATPELAACYFLGEPLPPGAAAEPGSRIAKPEPYLMVDADYVVVKRNGERFTIFWVGSSNWMSEVMHARFRA